MTAFIERYSRPAIILHWVIGLLMIVNVGLGLTFTLFGDDNIRPLINTHKSIGITILGLAIMRLLWRATHKPPPLPATYKPWERRASHAVHGLLYILIFALPLSGWFHDSAWKMAGEIKMFYFGLFEWPRIGWIMDMEPLAKENLHSILGAVHENLGFALYALFFLHVGGALKHQFFDKERELQRMWR